MSDIDDLLGMLPKSTEVVKSGSSSTVKAVTPEDELLGMLPPAERTVLPIRKGSGGPGPSFEVALGVLEQIPAGTWGLGSMIASAGAATVNTGREKLRQWLDGTDPRVKGAAVYNGKSLGDIWTEEYRSASENAAQMYVPITPTGAEITKKISEWMGQAIQFLGDQFYEKGIPTPLGIPIGKGTPAAGAFGQAVATIGTMVLPTSRRATRPTGVEPPPSPVQVWESFGQKYPETVKRMDTVGSVRMGDFIQSDKTMFDVIHRRLNSDLGLQGESTNIPLAQKVQLALQKEQPTADLVEIQKATRAFMDQISQLDAARDARANMFGLPAPRPNPAISSDPVVVTPGGTAITPEQAAARDAAFMNMTPQERADTLGVSAIGRLRLRLEEVEAARSNGNTALANKLDRQLSREWAQTFPYRNVTKRADALDAFKNFGGRLTWEEASGRMGDPTNVGASRGYTRWGPEGPPVTPAPKMTDAQIERALFPSRGQRGMIDIEGLYYTLQSFQDLPAKEVLKASTVLGAINQQKVPQAERVLIQDIMKDRDSISVSELKSEVAANVLPLRGVDTLDYSAYGLSNIGVDIRIRWTNSRDYNSAPAVSPPARTTVWRMPMESGMENHFGDRQYFAHTRSFDRAGARHIVELQSDLIQKLNNRPDVPQISLEDAPAYRAALREVMDSWGPGDQITSLDDVRSLTPGSAAIVQQVMRERGWDRPDVPYGANGFIDGGKLAEALEDKLYSVNVSGDDLGPAKRLSDRWAERILLEENRRAAEQGVRVMRMADADTVAKVEGWPVGEDGKLVPEVQGIYRRYRDDIPKILKQQFGARYVKGADIRTIEQIDAIQGKMLNAVHKFDDASFAELRGQLDGVLRKNKLDALATKEMEELGSVESGIPAGDDRYRNHGKVQHAIFGIKKLLDDNANGWWEWDVRPQDADRKIMAFGGKQRGAIILEGFEDVQKKMANAGREVIDATGRAWPLGSEEYEKAAAAKVQATFNDSLARQEKSVKQNFGGSMSRIKRGLIGHDVDLRVLLENSGEYGQLAKDRMVLQRGATDAARVEMQAVNERIFNDLAPADKKLVDELARARRIVEIDDHKGLGKVRHEGGITGQEAEAWVRQLRRDIGDERFARLNGKVSEVFKVYEGLLRDRLNEGIIDQKTFDRLLHFDYKPEQYVDLIDPMFTYEIGDRRVSVRASGIQDLSGGRRLNTMDTQQLLAEAIGRTRNQQFKNRTLSALLDLAREQPDSALVKIVGDGKPGGQKPAGYTRIGLMDDGVKREIFMPDELAHQLLTNPQPMLPWVANAINVMSGSAALRATAVGANPIFPIAGIPMDIFHTWLASGKAYSPHLPIYLPQIGRDMIRVLPDVISKGDNYQQAMREGLGAHFSTSYGQHVFTRDRTMAERVMPKYEKVMHVLRGFNQEADIIVRLAHRQRLIDQGIPSEQATAMARDRLDYAQGGELIKALDTAIPWTNVSVQALYKVARNARKNPGDFTVRATWLAGAVGGSVLANMISSPETWQSIPDRDKVNSLIITFGDQLYMDDPDGNRRYLYVPIRMDQTASPILGTVVAGLEAAEYGRSPSEVMKQSAGAGITLFNGIDMIPTLSAGIAMSGLDPFTGRAIADSPHARPSTSPIAKAIGDATGQSPVRLETAFGKLVSTSNPWMQLAGAGIKELLFEDDPRTKEKLTEYMLAEHLRPVVKMTNPLTKYLEGVDEKIKDVTDQQTRQRDALDEILYKVSKGQANRSAIETYIKNQPREDQERLVERAKHGYAIDQVMKRYEAGNSPGVPPAAWWRVLASAPARARAQEFHNRWLEASPEDRRKMENIASGMSRVGVSFVTEDFRRELVLEKKRLGEDRR